MNSLFEILLYSYNGLEIAASLQKVNMIVICEVIEMFAGLPYIYVIMARDSFKAIRKSLPFFLQYDHEVAVRFPLWQSRNMLHHFMVNAATYDVPFRTMSLNENTIRWNKCTTPTR